MSHGRGRIYVCLNHSLKSFRLFRVVIFRLLTLITLKKPFYMFRSQPILVWCLRLIVKRWLKNVVLKVTHLYEGNLPFSNVFGKKDRIFRHVDRWCRAILRRTELHHFFNVLEAMSSTWNDYMTRNWPLSNLTSSPLPWGIRCVSWQWSPSSCVTTQAYSSRRMTSFLEYVRHSSCGPFSSCHSVV